MTYSLSGDTNYIMAVEAGVNREFSFKKLSSDPGLLITAGVIVAFGSIIYGGFIEGGRIDAQAQVNFPDKDSKGELDEALSLRYRAYRELDQAILTDQTILEISSIGDIDRQKRARVLLQDQEQVEELRKAFLFEEHLQNVKNMLLGAFGGLVLASAGAMRSRR